MDQVLFLLSNIFRKFLIKQNITHNTMLLSEQVFNTENQLLTYTKQDNRKSQAYINIPYFCKK